MERLSSGLPSGMFPDPPADSGSCLANACNTTPRRAKARARLTPRYQRPVMKWHPFPLRRQLGVERSDPASSPCPSREPVKIPPEIRVGGWTHVNFSSTDINRFRQHLLASDDKGTSIFPAGSGMAGKTRGRKLSMSGFGKRQLLRSLATSACMLGALGLMGATASAEDAGELTAKSFTADFSAMAQLKDVATKGKGKIGILLPETTTSARYTSFDAPYLKKAFAEAGLAEDQFIITNAQGSESTQLTQAQSDISQGATVLLMDPISSGVGASVESYAKKHGVKVIDYDRLTLGGDRSYYVSFDNVEVGKKIGEGMVSCIADWKISEPHILIMRGAPTDNNATLFAQGYDGVLKPHFDSKDYVKVGEPAGTWDPAAARTTFEEQYTAHKDINAVVTPNDDNANAV
ncbi:MAG: hypothetical protein EPN45_23500, partial [Rhizobiaceae bacterium]